MNHEKKKEKNINILIIASIAFLLVAFVIIGIFLVCSQNDELNESANSILYVKEESEEEEILIVELNEEKEENNDEAEEEEQEEESNDETDSNTTYYIKVNNEANVVTIYKKDSSGAYNTAVKAMVCSVGTSTPTSGVYTISDKYTWRLLVGRSVSGNMPVELLEVYYSIQYHMNQKTNQR